MSVTRLKDLISPSPGVLGGLEPFAQAFREILLPQAAEGEYFIRTREPTKEELRSISGAVESMLEKACGHRVDPAIYVHGLKVCCHFYFIAGTHFEDLERRQHHTDLIDDAFVLLGHLESFHDLYDMYLRIG